MNENIHAIDEQESAPAECRFAADIETIFSTALYKRISNVTIEEPTIRDAFSRFVSDVECGKTFSVIDMLGSAEAVVKGKSIKINAGAAVYSFDGDSLGDNRFSKFLLNNSTSSFFDLLSVQNGIAFDISCFNDSLVLAQTVRYLTVLPEKEQSVLKKAEKNGVKLTKVGELLSQNKIILTDKNDIVKSYDKDSIVFNDGDSESVSMGIAHLEAFKEGYNAVLSVILCNVVTKNNIVRFGLDGDLNTVCARALGFYTAVTYHRSIPLKFVLTLDSSVNVASARPDICDGDYLYFLKLRNDINGMTDKIHYGQLHYYLKEKRKNGIIKDVLPIRENIQNVINRLCGDSLEYEKLADLPDNCFGIIVSVGRGESVNGVKLGYFRDN